MPVAIENVLYKADMDLSEELLISRCRSAIDVSHWVVGECASQWTQRHAKGRTDADFAKLVDLSQEQVNQRRRTWETFGDVYQECSNLRWSHFLVALTWDDAADCLSWANSISASVREMVEYRKRGQARSNSDDEPESAADHTCTTSEVVDHKSDCATDRDATERTESNGEDGEQQDRIEPETPVTRKPEVERLPDLRDVLDAIDKLGRRIESGGTREQLEEIAHRYEVWAFRIRKQLEAIS